MKILLAGEESAGVRILRAIAQLSDHQIVAVLASPPQESSKGPCVWDVAAQLGYPTWPAELVRDPSLAKRSRAEGVDLLLNVHSLHIIHKEVLDAAHIGSFNMHPGPLPRYAGLNAVSWAIYRGELEHGVTIHQMLPEIDAGPIAYQTCFPIEKSDTALSLSAKCVKEGIKLMLQLVETAALNPDNIPQISQDTSQREYFGREVPENGRLVWSWPARKIANFIRACDYFPFPSPWGYPMASMGNQDIAVVKASLTGRTCDKLPGTVGQPNKKEVEVACGDEWLLISKLRLNERYTNPVDILNPGERLDDGR